MVDGGAQQSVGPQQQRRAVQATGQEAGLAVVMLPTLLHSCRIITILNKEHTVEGLTASAEASTVAVVSSGSIHALLAHRGLP